MQHFPAGFRWGSATAALQIEGAQGRGPSVWDVFCQDHPERIHERATPERACDHFTRWREDVRWMRELGHNAYRFSLSWPRVLAGGGDFYDRLIDALLEAGIEPNVTLYHWDLPAHLGSWQDPAVVGPFLDFAALAFERYGDRVKRWCTLNEPAWTTLNGYVTGLHPPNLQNHRAALCSARNLLAAHTGAARACHQLTDGEVGIALNLSPIHPVTPADEEAAWRADGMLNRWFLEPVLHGRFPADIEALYASCDLLPEPVAVDEPVDFLGVNYYYPQYASREAAASDFHLNTSGRPEEECRFSLAGQFRFVKNPRGSFTDWNWEIDPGGLRQLLLRVHAERPGLPIYVTENGLGLSDRLVDGQVQDPQRIEFVSQHLQAVHAALEAGANVRGYYMWSLLDNFSWVNGYKKRYGFLYVDRETMERTPKASAWWFRDVARRNAL